MASAERHAPAPPARMHEIWNYPEFLGVCQIEQMSAMQKQVTFSVATL
jgi:hypothetical protein